MARRAKARALSHHTSDETAGVLIINNPGGPCRIGVNGQAAPMSCLAFLPRLLGAGATLTVWWPDPGGGVPHKQTFVGGQP